MTTPDQEQQVTATMAATPVPEEPAPAGTGRRPTAAALGAAFLVWERLMPGGGVGRLRDMAVGAAFEAEETTAGMLADVRRAAARRRQRMAELAERGALERARGRRRAGAAVEGAAMAIATSAIVDRVVDAQLERVLRPLVLAVLDDVLLLLEKEPERIQSLIRGQRDSMVDELVSRIRTGAATGDTAVDRLTSLVFHRSRQAVPAPPPATP